MLVALVWALIAALLLAVVGLMLKRPRTVVAAQIRSLVDVCSCGCTSSVVRTRSVQSSGLRLS